LHVGGRGFRTQKKESRKMQLPKTTPGVGKNSFSGGRSPITLGEKKLNTHLQGGGDRGSLNSKLILNPQQCSSNKNIRFFGGTLLRNSGL